MQPNCWSSVIYPISGQRRESESDHFMATTDVRSNLQNNQIANLESAKDKRGRWAYSDPAKSVKRESWSNLTPAPPVDKVSTNQPHQKRSPSSPAGGTPYSGEVIRQLAPFLTLGRGFPPSYSISSIQTRLPDGYANQIYIALRSENWQFSCHNNSFLHFVSCPDWGKSGCTPCEQSFWALKGEKTFGSISRERRPAATIWPSSSTCIWGPCPEWTYREEQTSEEAPYLTTRTPLTVIWGGARREEASYPCPISKDLSKNTVSGRDENHFGFRQSVLTGYVLNQRNFQKLNTA